MREIDRQRHIIHTVNYTNGVSGASSACGLLRTKQRSLSSLVGFNDILMRRNCLRSRYMKTMAIIRNIWRAIIKTQTDKIAISS